MRGFQIAVLPIGAGELGICPIPGRHGDYPGDLSQVLRWGPGLVLTMVEQDELSQVGAAGFGTDLADAGIDWHHLPIGDFGAPGAKALDGWPEASGAAHDVLGRGGRVLVHCFGGCGRSGMVLLRLMIEAGEAPETALLRLRSARPCAVETSAQQVWAYAGQPDGPEL